MSINRIQFQPGLSMPEFLKQFGTEELCETVLEQARWPQGLCAQDVVTLFIAYLELRQDHTKHSSAKLVGIKHRSSQELSFRVQS